MGAYKVKNSTATVVIQIKSLGYFDIENPVISNNLANG